MRQTQGSHHITSRLKGFNRKPFSFGKKSPPSGVTHWSFIINWLQGLFFLASLLQLLGSVLSMSFPVTWSLWLGDFVYSQISLPRIFILTMPTPNQIPYMSKGCSAIDCSSLPLRFSCLHHHTTSVNRCRIATHGDACNSITQAEETEGLPCLRSACDTQEDPV